MGAFTSRAHAMGLEEESIFSAIDTVWVLIAAFLVFFNAMRLWISGSRFSAFQECG
jgi:hypothetical protein